ncbi:MAG: exo-alpha-sialidase [Maritimibacter sp.]
MQTSLTLLIGTTKGAFLLTSDPARQSWSVSGPHCEGWPINHLAADAESGTLWAAGGSVWEGAGIWRSTDNGASWQLTTLANGKFADPEIAAKFGMPAPDPAPHTGAFDSIWSLHHTDGALYAGTRPAELLVSRDGGESFDKLDSIANHPGRETWQPGAAGMTLHTIVTAPEDPKKLWLGISAAGVFASEDGGVSWERRNRRDNSESPAHTHADGTRHEPGAETGLCVHNMVRAPGASGDRLYQQNHHGVFRSADGGRSWQDIGAGLPSTFGFPIAVHPRDPDTIWVLPLNGDSLGRFPPDASAAVWKSSDGGETWQDKRAGLPARDCYFTVLRQAMTTDTQDPAGVYFGTNSGSIFASTDEGENWNEIARHLPTVLCVELVERA